MVGPRKMSSEMARTRTKNAPDGASKAKTGAIPVLSIASVDPGCVSTLDRVKRGDGADRRRGSPAQRDATPPDFRHEQIGRWERDDGASDGDPYRCAITDAAGVARVIREGIAADEIRRRRVDEIPPSEANVSVPFETAESSSATSGPPPFGSSLSKTPGASSRKVLL